MTKQPLMFQLNCHLSSESSPTNTKLFFATTTPKPTTKPVSMLVDATELEVLSDAVRDQVTGKSTWIA